MLTVIGKRNLALDGLRAFAVGFVMLKHMEPDKVPGGFIGVDIFFSLSGYLITSLLLREFRSTGSISFSSFYARRSARLMPAFLLLLIVAFTIVQIAPHHMFKLREVIIAGTYTMNWARALNLGDSTMLGHTWSLAAEEQFYLLWPPILFFAMNLKPSKLHYVPLLLAFASILTGIALFCCGASVSRTYNGFDVRSVEMLIGCASAFLPLTSNIDSFCAMYWYIPVLVLLSALLIHEGSPILPLGGYALLGILSSWLIIAIQKRARLVLFLENPIFVYLGQISYGMYLWHFLLIAVRRLLGLPHWSELVLLPSATIAIASLSYYVIEQPILRSTRKLVHAANQPLASTI